jgi:hypothetical protein
MHHLIDFMLVSEQQYRLGSRSQFFGHVAQQP